MEQRHFHCKRIIIALVLFGLSSLAIATASLEGEDAPNFALKSHTGDNHRLSEYKGRVVMLNFWATWCGPCRQEIPHLNELYQTYEKLGFVVLGVNLDEKHAGAKNLLAELEATYPTLFDGEKTVSRMYQVDAMPTTVLIDRDGKVRHIHRGYRPGYIERYQAQVRRLLSE